MFRKETYVSRRAELKKLVKSGIIILFGNNNSPANYPSNAYYPFRQDSSFLYFFGQQRDGLVGVIDIDNDRETLVGDDIDIEDIVWYGSVDSVSDMAAQVGVAHTAPMKALKTICNDAMSQHRTIHFLPPYRFDIKLQIFDQMVKRYDRTRPTTVAMFPARAGAQRNTPDFKTYLVPPRTERHDRRGLCQSAGPHCGDAVPQPCHRGRQRVGAVRIFRRADAAFGSSRRRTAG